MWTQQQVGPTATSRAYTDFRQTMKENGGQGIVETHGPTAGLLLGAWGVQRLELD